MRLRTDVVAVALAVTVVIGVAVAMNSLSYDVWGAFVLGPVLMAVSYPLLCRLFVGDRADLLPLAVLGLLAKFVGAGFRYWVSYHAYLGFTDSANYHRVGSVIAARARAGELGVFDFLPHSLGTRFVEQLTGVVYTVTGPTRLGGALVFGTLAFWGSVCYLLAALTAVPGLRRRWYAGFVFFAPSLVYWPSSVGKESWMFFTLGVGTYGTTLLLASSSGRRRRGFVLASLGFLGGAFVRPHVVAMWVAGAAVALVVAIIARRRDALLVRRASVPGVVRRTRSEVASLALGLVVAAVGLVVVATVTLRYLDPMSGEGTSAGLGDRVTRILDETQRRSSEGGSVLTPVVVEGPTDWPVAVVSTLVRPFPWEIDDLVTLLPGVEMVVFVVLGTMAARRILSVPRQFRGSPYLLMVVCATFMFGLAFSSIGNLGILTRQRSLVLPFGVLLLCIPYAPKRTRRVSTKIGVVPPVTVP